MFNLNQSTMNPSSNRTILERQIGVVFQNKALLEQVFVHRSYLNEIKDSPLTSNEKLEFLGDSVLSLATSIYLYRHYPHLQEGDYTDIKASIVRTESLAASAKNLDLGSYLYLSRGEEKSKGRSKTNILADVFEALIGAIFLDAGFERAQDFINTYLFQDKLDHLIAHKLYLSPKSRLQEITQAKHKELPEYRLVTEAGPEHHKQFTVEVYIMGKKRGSGSGHSKKAAEEEAAQNALDFLT